MGSSAGPGRPGSHTWSEYVGIGDPPLPEPSHRRKAFSAQRVFTDREDNRSAFLRALNLDQDADSYRVLVFYGAGGQGKTALCEHFQDLLAERICKWELDRGGARPGFASLDLESPPSRRPDTGLLSLRLQLQDRAGIRFPAFDVAYARYFTLTRPGMSLRDHHPELFREENEILEDLLGVAGDVLAEIPGIGLAYKYLDRWGRRARAWWRERGLEVLAGTDELKAHELLQELPKYFGADLCDAMFSNQGESPPNHRKARPVILLDSYEALWRDSSNRSGYGALRRADQWPRRLVAETPGVLFLLFSRDRLRWGELDPDYQRSMQRYQEAQRLYLEALDILRTEPGPNHPDTLMVEENYRVLLKRLGSETDPDG